MPEPKLSPFHEKTMELADAYAYPCHSRTPLWKRRHDIVAHLSSDPASEAMEVLRDLLDRCADESQSEYDGQTYTSCTYCGANDLTKPVIEHRKDCAWDHARSLAAKEPTQQHPIGVSGRDSEGI